MLELTAGLAGRALQAIAELERAVIEADGGRLKLEWGALRQRRGDLVEDLLWWEGERLLGFLGIYSFASPLELAGMVAPGARGRGIGSALLDAALPLCRERGDRPPLLIVPRPSVAGKHLALRRDGMLDHSEHALVLSGGPQANEPPDRAIGLRPARPEDVPVIARLLEVGFGVPAPDGLADGLDSPRDRSVVVELSGAPVGTMRLQRDGDAAGIYGFVIDPSRQGRGIGRAALRLACEQLLADGARRIGLEVDVQNDRALGLYTSVGFASVAIEDYYALPWSGDPSRSPSAR